MMSMMNPPSSSFSLHVSLIPCSESGIDVKEQLEEIQKALASPTDGCIVVPASRARLVQHENVLAEEADGSYSTDQQPDLRYALVFVPATFVDSSLPSDVDQLVITGSAARKNLSSRLLSMIHPLLATNLELKAVIPVRPLSPSCDQTDAPADLVLLDLSHTPGAAIDDLLQQIGQSLLHSGPDAVLKLILLRDVQFNYGKRSPGGEVDEKKAHDIPTCPVCLHRIDPCRLGWSSGPTCSKRCSPAHCPRQNLLRPWPPPARCAACRIIGQYWFTIAERHGGISARSGPRCGDCTMQETLWVCLTCGFVGCGRYSNKHAEAHFEATAHPFCLELSTLRIWDYVLGEFRHRSDLLECPSSPVHATQSAALLLHGNPSSAEEWTEKDAILHRSGSFDKKSPKKANRIGEEYEILLQSALEDQAQHYEGEISHLVAKLTGDGLDHQDESAEARQEISTLQTAIGQYRNEIESMSRQLVELQSQEAGHRAASQRLLREQQVSQDIIKELRQEIGKERDEGRAQVDELEQQIADLTANQQMRHQFSQDQELLNAQIFGTTATANIVKKGKKTRRNRR